MAAPSMKLLAAAHGAFSPLDIPWVDVYWTEGPNFLALGLTEGNSVPTWPTETGTGADLSAGVYTQCVLDAEVPEFNNRPSVKAVGVNLMTVAATSLSQPWTVVVVGRRVGGNTSANFIGSSTDAAGGAGLSRTAFAAGTTLVHTTFEGPGYMEALANGASSEIYINGVLDTTGDAGTLAVARRQMFARAGAPTSPLTGDILFGAYLDRALTTQERADFDAWVTEHY